MSKTNLPRKKFWLIVVLTIIATLLVDHFVWKDNIVGAKPTVSYSDLHLRPVAMYPTCGDTSYDRYCTHHGSGWNAYAVGSAAKAGKIGPHWVAVPAKVRANFRRAVIARGPKFTTQVKNNFKQWGHDVWKVYCVLQIGKWAARKQDNPDYNQLPKCLTAKQMLASMDTKILKPALKCGGDALIGIGIGSMIQKAGEKGGGAVGALIGSATCGATGAWDYYVENNDSWQLDAHNIWHGFKSLTVSAARNLHYM